MVSLEFAGCTSLACARSTLRVACFSLPCTASCCSRSSHGPIFTSTPPGRLWPRQCKMPLLHHHFFHISTSCRQPHHATLARHPFYAVVCTSPLQYCPLHTSFRRQVIFGRGNASIGLHYDKDNACAGGSRQPVSTYLAISAGRKLVLLLPPGQRGWLD